MEILHANPDPRQWLTSPDPTAHSDVRPVPPVSGVRQGRAGASPAAVEYFAYGANMSVQGMALRCPGARVIGPATLDGHAFLINANHFATIVPAAGKRVYGVLWTLTAAHRQSLDEYEGVPFGMYRRHTVRVTLPDGGARAVLAYVARDATPTRTRGEYLEVILSAARAHGLPPEYVDEIADWQAP